MALLQRDQAAGYKWAPGTEQDRPETNLVTHEVTMAERFAGMTAEHWRQREAPGPEQEGRGPATAAGPQDRAERWLPGGVETWTPRFRLPTLAGPPEPRCGKGAALGRQREASPGTRAHDKSSTRPHAAQSHTRPGPSALNNCLQRGKRPSFRVRGETMQPCISKRGHLQP